MKCKPEHYKYFIFAVGIAFVFGMLIMNWAKNGG